MRYHDEMIIEGCNKVLACNNSFLNSLFQLAFLQYNRYVEFHAKQGKVHQLRIPFFGRDLAYIDTTGEIYFVGVRFVLE